MALLIEDVALQFFAVDQSWAAGSRCTHVQGAIVTGHHGWAPVQKPPWAGGPRLPRRVAFLSLLCTGRKAPPQLLRAQACSVWGSY